MNILHFRRYFHLCSIIKNNGKISFRGGDDSCWFQNFFGLVVPPTHFMGLFRFSYLLNYFKFNSSPALIYSFHKFEEQHEGYLNHKRVSVKSSQREKLSTPWRFFKSSWIVNTWVMSIIETFKSERRLFIIFETPSNFYISNSVGWFWFCHAQCKKHLFIFQ